MQTLWDRPLRAGGRCMGLPGVKSYLRTDRLTGWLTRVPHGIATNLPTRSSRSNTLCSTERRTCSCRPAALHTRGTHTADRTHTHTHTRARTCECVCCRRRSSRNVATMRDPPSVPAACAKHIRPAYTDTRVLAAAHAATFLPLWIHSRSPAVAEACPFGPGKRGREPLLV